MSEVEDTQDVVVRTEYRAIALDPDRTRKDDFYGSKQKTAHAAHLALEEEWTIDDREVLVERRGVSEYPWVEAEK